jgi:hypothetical protein
MGRKVSVEETIIERVSDAAEVVDVDIEHSSEGGAP